MSTVVASGVHTGDATERGGRLQRYNLFERVVHWTVAITFIALMLSGLALGYPRLYWLSGLFGGGQTMRAAHPWIGVVFTVGIVVMLVMWAKPMRTDAEDRRWMKQLRQYVATGHSDADTGRWNAGQKGYFWFSVVLAVILLVTGIPLWFPSSWGSGLLQWSRFLHHLVFLLAVAGFIIHVLLSALMDRGTMDGMTSGRVSTAWAAHHHPRWFREQRDRVERAGEAETAT
jgi:formate dehydrogenase subunit gamma